MSTDPFVFDVGWSIENKAMEDYITEALQKQLIKPSTCQPTLVSSTLKKAAAVHVRHVRTYLADCLKMSCFAKWRNVPYTSANQQEGLAMDRKMFKKQPQSLMGCATVLSCQIWSGDHKDIRIGFKRKIHPPVL